MKNRKRFTAFAFTAAFVFSMVGNMNSLAEEGLYEAETLVTDSTEAETTETEETELTSEESAETELTKEETEETESTESTIVSSVNPSTSTWYDQTFYVTPGETSVFTIKMEDYDDTLALRQVWLTVVDESYNWGTPDESIALISTDGETVMVTGVSVGETYGVFRIGVGESADMSNLSGYFNFTIIVEEEQLPEIIADATTDSYTIGSDINAVIKCSGELSEFVSVAVDDVLVDASNYDLTEGSTIITFHKAYMDSLSVGEHKVTLTYTDGRTVSTSLVVYEAEKTTEAMEAETTMTESETVATESETTTTEAETKATESETESETDSSAVETGDNSPIAIYILVMVLAMTIMAAGAVERKVRRN